MRFSGLRFGADDQERILETSLVQNGGLLKHGDRTHGQEELLPRGCEEWLVIYLAVGGGGEGMGDSWWGVMILLSFTFPSTSASSSLWWGGRH